MSARIFCGGCGEEMPMGKCNIARIQTSTCDGKINSEDYQLCGSCLDTVRFYFNPTLWPRNGKGIRTHGERSRSGNAG